MSGRSDRDDTPPRGGGEPSDAGGYSFVRKRRASKGHPEPAARSESRAPTGAFEPEEFDPMASGPEPSSGVSGGLATPISDDVGTEAELDFGGLEDDDPPARVTSPLETAPFGGAALEPGPAITGEFDPMADEAAESSPASEFVTGEFDPFGQPLPDARDAAPPVIDGIRSAHPPRIRSASHPSARSIEPEEVGEFDLGGTADDFPSDLGVDERPSPRRMGRSATASRLPAVAQDDFGAGYEPVPPSRRPGLSSGGLKPRPTGPMQVAKPKPEVDLAQFAAEMDQLAAELEAAVARRPPSGASEPASSPSEAPASVTSASLEAVSAPTTERDFELAVDDSIPLPEPDWGAVQEPLVPSEPEPLAANPAEVDGPSGAGAAGARSGRADSGAWDPFEDDIFERGRSGSGEVPSIDQGLASGSALANGAPDLADGATADWTPELDVDPRGAGVGSEVSPLDTGSMPALAGAAAEASPRMTGAHEALDFGDLDNAGDLDLDADAIDVQPRQQRSSQTMWSGPAIAEPVRTGEHTVPTRSAEFSADFDAPTQDDPELLSAVREYFRTLDKTIRVFNLYEGKGKSVARALTTAYRELGQLLERHRQFRLRVTPYEFVLGEDPVYTSEEDKLGLTYQLFRDGVRELTVERGISEEELAGLLDVLRRTQRTDEDDSVTLLWQLDLQHVSYRAVDVFLEGMVDAGGDRAQQAIDELVELASAPLHSGATVQAKNRSLKALPDELVTKLAERGTVDDPAEIAAALGGAESDLWRRSIWLCLKLSEEPAAQASVAKLLATIFEEMLQKGRWRPLAAASEAVAAIRDRQDTTGSPLAIALDHLTTGDRLVDFAEVFELAATADVPAIISFLRLLPVDADRSLLTILGRLPAGPLESKLAELLEERGVDLTTYHRGRLGDASAGVVVSAVRALGRLSGEAATLAIHSQLTHGNWRIVLAAITTLEERIDRPSTELVSCLLGESHQVRDKALELLEKLPVTDEASATLIDVVLESDKERWTDKQKKAAAQVLVRWGGTAADERLVQILTQGNPFRRRRIEDLRQQIFEAVQGVGGERARTLLTVSLMRKPPAAVRKGMQLVLERLERQAQATEEAQDD
jgi:hypothetical protein